MQTKELIEALRKAEGSEALRGVYLGQLNAEMICKKAADALEAQGKAIFTMLDERGLMGSGLWDIEEEYSVTSEEAEKIRGMALNPPEVE